MKDINVNSSVGLSRRQFGGIIGLTSASVASWLGGVSESHGKDKISEALAVPRGLFSFTFGVYTVYPIMDGMIPMKRGLFSGDEATIDKVLKETGQTDEIIPSPISAFLLKSQSKNILIDSGMGSLDMMGPGFGNLIPGLAATNTKPVEVDTVIITHAHPDHIGGMLDKSGKVVFPNAEVVISGEEVKFWTDASIMAKVPEGARGAFSLAQKTFKAYSSQIKQVTEGAEVSPGVVVKSAAGHTPGHSMLHIDGGGSKELLMIADTLHNTELHTALPDIKFAFDVDPADAAKTRRKIFDQLATDKSLALCSHAHFPGLGRVLKHGDVYRYSVASI